MDASISTSYSAASYASRNQGRAAGLNLAAAQDPTAESITAAKQADVQAQVSMKVLAKALETEQQSSAGLTDLLSGVGRYVDTYG